MPPDAPTTNASAAATTGGAEPLMDKFGRTYEQVRASGKNVIARLNKVTRLFMPRGGRKPGSKAKPTMEKPPVTPLPPDPSPPPAAPSTPAAEPPPAAPSFADIAALAASPSPGGTDDPADFKTALLAVASNPTAESVIGIIQTALILIGGADGKLDDLEKSILRPPLIRVLKKYSIGADVMPAEVDLVIALLAVFASKLQRPKFATKWEQLKAWAVAKYRGHTLASELRREAPGVLSQSRPPAPGEEAAADYLERKAFA